MPLLNSLLVRIIATGITLIGFIIAFFVIDYYARRRALIEVAKLERQQKKQKKLGEKS